MAAKLRMPGTPLSIAFRAIQPTWRNYIQYVDLAARNGDEDMKKLITYYQGLPKKEQRVVMPEQLCDAVGVKPSELIAAVAGSLWESKASESTMVAAMYHPTMVEQTAMFGAAMADNGRDRELFFRVTGSLPDRKGTSIVINSNPQTLVAGPGQPQRLIGAGGGGYKGMAESTIDMSRLLDEPTAVPMSTKDDEDIEDADDEEDDTESEFVPAVFVDEGK